MRKVYIFTLYDDKGASSQFRTFIYKSALEKDFCLKWNYFWDNKYVSKYMVNKKKYRMQIAIQYVKSTVKRAIQLLVVAPKCDVVYLQKACFPKSKLLLLKHLKGKTKIVFDVDDAVYLSNKDNSENIAKIADIVICGNENLMEHYSKINPHCCVIPTVENTHEYMPVWRDTFENKIIGWIGSKVTLDNLDLIISPINSFIDKHPEVKFHIISNDAGEYIDKINNCEFIQWKKDQYVKDMSQFTIGVMPLKDTKYNRGKCGFKLIQYLNMRKPVIGSPVGVNSEIIEGNGLAPINDKQWEEALEKLLYDRCAYDNYIYHIDNFFFAKYHFDSAYGKLKEILES